MWYFFLAMGIFFMVQVNRCGASQVNGSAYYDMVRKFRGGSDG
jgi:hypothetical protein